MNKIGISAKRDENRQNIGELNCFLHDISVQNESSGFVFRFPSVDTDRFPMVRVESGISWLYNYT